MGQEADGNFKSKVIIGLAVAAVPTLALGWLVARTDFSDPNINGVEKILTEKRIETEECNKILADRGYLPLGCLIDYTKGKDYFPPEP